MHPSPWILVGTISISSFWKLNYFSEMTCPKNLLSDMVSCSSSIQLITSDFSLILELDINPGYIHWTWNQFQLEELKLNVSHMCVLNNLRKSVYSYHSSQFAVAYSAVPRGILISLNHHGHTKTEPKFFTTSLIKGP